MSDLDIAKEKIAYLKVWLGILLLHRRIDRHIQSLKEL